MHRISVIIPTLNEQERLPRCLASTRALLATEVIVADGGSLDGTVAAAREFGASVVECGRGRARQLNAGAAIATGDVLLFLHADCVLPSDARPALEHALRSSDVGCGSFRHRIDSPRVSLKWIAAADNFRARWLNRPYGDQGIFVRRRVFLEVGGFPEVEILEDVRLMQRLRKVTRYRLAESTLIADARRWDRRGVLRTTLLNWTILVGGACGAPTARLARLYYGEAAPTAPTT